MINSTGVTFTVGEQETGTPYIQMWVDEKVLGMPNEPAVLEVKPGSSMQEVEAIKNYLNANIVSFSLYPSGLSSSANK